MKKGYRNIITVLFFLTVMVTIANLFFVTFASMVAVRTGAWIFSSFLLSLMVLMMLVYRKNYLKGASRVRQMLYGLTKYDLTIKAPVDGRVDGDVKIVTQTVAKWRDIVEKLQSITVTISTSTSDVWSAINGNIKAVENQNIQAEQIATATEEMSQTAMDIAGNASRTAELSRSVIRVAREGTNAMKEASISLEKLNDSTLSLSGLIKELNESVQDIGNIINLINDIADQTNLLALNAAIEAARAGEHGRGFAVVADEVRKLAEKTLMATGDIGKKITSIMEKTGETVLGMQRSKEHLDNVTMHIQDTNEHLAGILSAAETSSEEITKIASAIEEQSSTTEEISQTIVSSTELSKEIMENVKEIIQKMDSLSREIMGIFSIIKTFRMPENLSNEVSQAKIAHKNWVQRLYRMYYASEKIRPDELTDHTKCQFGKWYYTAGQVECGEMEDFRLIEAPHRMIHKEAKSAVEAFINGNKELALEKIESVDSLSHQIVGHLDNLLNGRRGDTSGGQGLKLSNEPHPALSVH